MKKIIIIILALGLFSACKSKENAKDTSLENRAKDDYQGKDDKQKNNETDFKKKNNNNSNELDEDGNNKADIESINGQDNTVNNVSWPQVERRGFISSCVDNAAKGGMARNAAQNYCDCMLEKMEMLYPDVQELAKLPRSEIQKAASKYVNDCLGK